MHSESVCVHGCMSRGWRMTFVYFLQCLSPFLFLETGSLIGLEFAKWVDWWLLS